MSTHGEHATEFLDPLSEINALIVKLFRETFSQGTSQICIAKLIRDQANYFFEASKKAAFEVSNIIMQKCFWLAVMRWKNSLQGQIKVA